MSFRDIRTLIEMLRDLTYPKLLSMESFRTPDFSLVADLLIWLAKRFDPDYSISLDISTENERVSLIRNVSEFMALKANVKLNTKRLYQSDGYVVKELLKITTVLYGALHIFMDEMDNDELEDSTVDLRNFDIPDKVNELKISRQIASEITATGANLFDLLGKEIDLRVARQKSIGKQFELSEVEAAIRSAIDSISHEISETKQLIDNISVTESNLDSKIERRNIEIDRYEKRLQTLNKVRPAFLEEFTSLEKELEQLFVQYSVRLRCLNQLERSFEASESMQAEKQLQITIPKIQTDLMEQADEDLVEIDRGGAVNRTERIERPRASTGGRNKHQEKLQEKDSKVYGSMQPPLFDDQSSLDLSTDTDSDDLLLDKDEPELTMHSDEESLGLELSMDRMAPSGRKTSNNLQENSDDDF
ncbi:unnamed protein product [Acanthoscelides obtectus]|uniref:Clusterin-associated protein 1 n=1 Tax=Acanthoscelides obtectus TaxID=200917 RepID=A0A9P0M0N2_ACAOB|nr:unnamed protein product [Acanthoscelides obtectus]CAK1679592.1 Clusterin-associated protein 1 [Acanthoscelides obtectus]